MNIIKHLLPRLVPSFELLKANISSKSLTVSFYHVWSYSLLPHVDFYSRLLMLSLKTFFFRFHPIQDNELNSIFIYDDECVCCLVWNLKKKIPKKKMKLRKKNKSGEGEEKFLFERTRAANVCEILCVGLFLKGKMVFKANESLFVFKYFHLQFLNLKLLFISSSSIAQEIQ